MKLSIVIPVYNEHKTLDEILDRIERVRIAPVDKEIVLVDDGSDDGTRQIIESYRGRPGYVVALHESNMGKGSAIRTGLAHVGGDIVLVQDADLEYDPCDYPALLAPLLEGQASVVYGSRRLKPDNGQCSALFYCGGVIVTWVANLLYNIRITDEPTCYKLFRKEVLDTLDLQCRGFEFCPEVTAKVAKAGIPIVEVPISYHPRSAREGKKIRYRDGLIAIWTLFRLRFS